MALSPEFDKIQSTKQLSFLVANGVECKLPLGEEEAKEIISTQVSTYLTSVECYNREVKYNGRAIFTVIYKQEGEIKKHETGVEYGYKASVENAVKEAKEELASEDNERIVKATEKLSNDVQGVFTKLYQQAQQSGGAPNGEPTDGDTEFHQ